MKVQIIGLGKMGLNLAYNLIDHGYTVFGTDHNQAIREKLESYGGVFFNDFEEMLKEPSDRTIVWLMLPSGQITNNQVETCVKKMRQGDILIDGGNSRYTDTLINGQKAQEKGIHFFDVGTSGGMSGARYGACMMVGGDATVFKMIEPIFSDVCVEKGYLYCGKVGSGHYLKMIHNGIEYGMMQAIGEGFNILHHCEFDYDLPKVATVYNHGSVIRSWLMELAENLLKDDASLQDIEGIIPSSGEGKWTIEEMLRLELTAPVITQALLNRYASQDEEKYGEKIVASLRNQFGGHEVIKK